MVKRSWAERMNDQGVVIRVETELSIDGKTEWHNVFAGEELVDCFRNPWVARVLSERLIAAKARHELAQEIANYYEANQ